MEVAAPPAGSAGEGSRMCSAGQMCVALDSDRTVALDGKHSQEEISALFQFVEIAVVMDFVPVLTCAPVQVDKYHLPVDQNLLSVKVAARMEDGVLDLIAVHVSTDLLARSVKEITEQAHVSHKLTTRCVRAS